LVGDLAARAKHIDFVNIERLVPDIYQNRELFLWTLARPRILKSHERFDCRYKRVIYIVRDPRDVLISYYNYALMMGVLESQTSLESYADSFLRGDVLMGSWQEHVESWLNSASTDREFLLLRYEGLLHEPIKHLVQVVRLLGLDLHEPALSAVVLRYTVDKMRELENKQWRRWKALKQKRADGRFIGFGVAGGWRQALPASLAKEVQIRWGNTMKRLSYL
jgi:hypothetical protein